MLLYFKLPHQLQNEFVRRHLGLEKPHISPWEAAGGLHGLGAVASPAIPELIERLRKPGEVAFGEIFFMASHLAEAIDSDQCLSVRLLTSAATGERRTEDGAAVGRSGGGQEIFFQGLETVRGMA